MTASVLDAERAQRAPTSSSARAVLGIAPLLLAVGLLMAGTGLGSSLLGLRASIEGFGTGATGLIMSGYYAGFMVGSVVTPRLIQQVGHIRVFSGLASLASVGVLVHVVLLDPVGWWLLRLLTGFCISGLFVVAETWMNGSATNRNRGQIIAAYMVVVTGGQAIGQLLLNLGDPAGFAAFVLTSVLVSLAVVPVALTRVRAPETPEPEPFNLRQLVEVAPLGAAGAAIAGFTGAIVVGLGAVYASSSGLSVARTALLLFSTLAAALVLQFPIGRASDRVDRRKVISLVAFVAAGCCVAATQLGGPERFVVLLPIAAVAGGLSFPLYSLASAHLNDYLPAGAVVAAGALMVLVNGAGAVLGPVLASVAMTRSGPDAFFAVLAIAYTAVGVYALYRLTRRSAVPAEDRATFVPLPSGTSPYVTTLTPGVGDELYPATDGSLERQHARLHWIERGTGDPVLLLHDAGSSAAVWDDVLLTLADTGHRAFAPDLRGHGQSSHTRPYDVHTLVDDLEALLAELRIATCPIVGHGHGSAVAVAFAQRHPERVDGLVLVSSDQLLDASGAKAVGPIAPVLDAGRAVLPRRIAAGLGASAAYGRHRDPQSYSRLATDLRRADPDAIAALRRATRRLARARALNELSVPVTTVRGGRLRRRREGDVIIEDAGHFVQIDQPDELGRAIAGFMQTLPSIPSHR